jgi:hypothetical protein
MGELLVGWGAGRRDSAYFQRVLSKTGEKKKMERAREGGH